MSASRRDEIAGAKGKDMVSHPIKHPRRVRSSASTCHSSYTSVLSSIVLPARMSGTYPPHRVDPSHSTQTSSLVEVASSGSVANIAATPAAIDAASSVTQCETCQAALAVGSQSDFDDKRYTLDLISTAINLNLRPSPELVEQFQHVMEYNVNNMANFATNSKTSSKMSRFAIASALMMLPERIDKIASMLKKNTENKNKEEGMVENAIFLLELIGWAKKIEDLCGCAVAAHEERKAKVIALEAELQERQDELEAQAIRIRALEQRMNRIIRRWLVEDAFDRAFDLD
ncbi:hypothetical protein B0T21DRAFT_432561 [Apiosordaria backusii]|uniref:Uncharacterized protein n=1 Tax=Apiosordaria backusii TaxID=314023 RepID=A0AA40DIN3_9PEZI|nr:hypothetical protein B0T21DRAFT_432561 [Apiosordaria backusii]